MTLPRYGAPKTVCAAAMRDVHKPEDGSGTADIEARLLATDAEALDQRLDAMAARGVRRTIRAPWISAAPMPWAP